MKFFHTAVAGAVLALAALYPCAARAAGPSDEAGRLLTQSRAALGGSALDRVKLLELQSKTTQYGLRGTGTQWLQIGGIRFAERGSNPPIDQSDGYDGKAAWTRDTSGMVWVDGSRLGRSLGITNAFISNYTLWSAGRGGATVAWGGTKKVARRAYDTLEITAPQSSLPFTLYFDRTTHLPARFVQTAGPNVTTTIYSNYHSVDGLMVPYAVHSDSSGNVTDVTVLRAIVNPAGALAHLDKPASSVRDFSMANGATESSIPFHLGENHVYLSLMLNGKGPYRFIFDTGGENAVDPEVAREVGASGFGSAQGEGVGTQTQDVTFTKMSTMQIGDAVLKDQLFGVAPTRSGFGVSAGQRVDGVIGFEVLARFITTFDYSRSVVILQMPGTTHPEPGSDVIPFVFNGTQPQFPCGIDGIASQCTLDTGARDSLSFYGPFVTDHPQVVPKTLTQLGVTGFGWGGPAYGRLGRLRELTIGSFALPNVVADYTAQQGGALAAPFVAANVGGNILKKFALRLDYTEQTMALIPNATLSATDAFERSGLFLISKGGKVVVFDARPGTASAQAGIVKGDTIDTVDGRPASSMSLEDVRALFFGAAGTVVQLGLIGKDGSQRTVALTLADVI
jgi:hypothetical protein